MPVTPRELLEFGPFTLDRVECVLRRHDQPVALPPKAFDLLVALATRPGRLVTKEELLKEVWPGTFVEEANLSYTVSLLRKVVEDDGGLNGFIETVPKKGYRFTERVRIVHPDPDQRPGWVAHPAVRWLTTAGIGVIAVGATYAVYALWGAPQPQGLPERFGLSTPAVSPLALTQLTYDSGLTTQPALSPDGQFLAYASDRGGGDNLEIWLQRRDGLAPVQLTHDSVTNHEPAFSPDGGSVAFRSERDGGGIYVMPAQTNGRSRFLAAGGHDPRYSPDGQLVAYWLGGGGLGGDVAAAGHNHVFIVPAGGGTPRPVLPEFASALWPVWAEDSRHLLVSATRDPLSPLGWFVVDVYSGRATDAKLQLPSRYKFGLPHQQIWSGNRILFSTWKQGPTSLWETHITAETWQVSESAEQLTSGTQHHVRASAAADGQIVFDGTTKKNQVWTVAIASEEGRVLGRPEKVTEGVAYDSQAAASTDGRTACYTRRDSRGEGDIFVKDFNTGIETLRVRGPRVAFPTISADGSRIAYLHGVGNRQAIEVARTSGGEPEQVLADCQGCVVSDWSHQNDRLSYYGADASPGQIFVLTLATGRTELVAGAAGHNLYESRFSPDDHWVSFLETVVGGHSRVWVAPLQNGRTATDSTTWIPVTEGDAWDDKPRWSPGGSMVYYTSDRDGFTCLWARHLDPVTRRPLGPSKAVQHFHSARLSMTDLMLSTLSLAVARDRLVFILGEHTGNIWTARLDPQR